MKYEGEHLILDIKGYKEVSNTKLKSIITQALKKSGAHTKGFKEHTFKPQGYSAIWLLSESHASIHTYPEHNGLFIDLFTCGNIKTEPFENYILKELNPLKVTGITLIRGN